jgi:DNA-binding NarL/FixJ family response regulator
MRVVIADDVMLVRSGLALLLGSAGVEVAGEAADGPSLMRLVDRERPDAAIVDIRMPPTNTDEGVRAAALIRAEHPATAVLVLSQYVNESYALRLLGEDATGVGYLLKDRVMEPTGFADAIREVCRGGLALDPEVVERMLERRRPGGPVDRLTEREREVLARMAEGRSNAAIAAALGISDATLHRHASAIFDKLDLAADAEGHRRVLAVLAYLRAQGD